MVYGPSEDTLFLKRSLESRDLGGKKVLEVGTGTGELAIYAAELGAEVTAVDSDTEAVKQVRQRASDQGLEMDIKESDLLENVEADFDLILFNPPYLPGDREGESDALVGGEKGTELTEEFIEQAVGHLNPEGEILFIASSLADTESLEEAYDLEKLDETELWFEKLFVYRLSA